MRDRQGRANAITIASPVRWAWAVWLWVTWPPATGFAPVRWPLQRPLLKLAFIHFAHWSLITRIPSRARPGAARRLRRPQLIFQSNYNGFADPYIEGFSYVVPGRMRLMWQGAYGFPGPRPVQRFTDFILAAATPTAHYYCAYPEASARMITSALRLRRRVRRFERRARDLDPERFAAAYRDLLAEVQQWL